MTGQLKAFASRMLGLRASSTTLRLPPALGIRGLISANLSSGCEESHACLGTVVGGDLLRDLGTRLAQRAGFLLSFGGEHGFGCNHLNQKALMSQPSSADTPKLRQAAQFRRSPGVASPARARGTRRELLRRPAPGA